MCDVTGLPAEVSGEHVQSLLFSQEWVKRAAVGAVDHVTLIGFPERHQPETHTASNQAFPAFLTQMFRCGAS